jgi:HlyD family secretion protein
MNTATEAANPAAITKTGNRSNAAPARGGSGGYFVAILAVLGLGAAGYFGIDLLGSNAQAGHEFVLHEVKSQDLDILVVERGSLESGKNVDLVCEVEARTAQAAATTILQIVKEGTHISKGELLVELDSASLKDQITQQKIKVEQAKASLTKSNTELEITRSQNDSDIQAAQIAVDLTDIDLKKYLEGDYLQERRNIDGEIVIAQEELNRAKERLEYSEKLSKKGYISTSEVEADRLAVTKAQNSLNVANEKLRVLDEYTKPRQVKDLGNKLDEAKRKLDRVRNEAKAKEAQSESGMLAQKLTTETEENTLRKLERQLEKCLIYAPTDGMVVYANDPGAAMRGQPQVQIEEGASVRERQKIIRIPDLDSMQVNVKVHEAKVSHVRPGQHAKVRVESMPDRILPGTVRTVATTADAQNWFSSGVQVYTVMVGVDEAVEGLKPGMTAEVEVMADRISNVVAVPVQAIVERETQNYCFVLAPGSKSPEIRRVHIGASNDKMVAIEKDTLKVGEVVVQNLTSVINEEELGARAKADAEKYKVEAPPAVAKAAVPGAPMGNGDALKKSAGTGGDGSAAKAGGGGRSRLLEQFDKNNDGKISLADEVPEDRRGLLAKMDTNNDGFIDATELAALASRGGGQGGGAPGGGGPGGGAPGGAPGGFQMPKTGAEWIKMSDKNGDGKVAKDELPEFAQNFFSTMDTNGDGFVDNAEADALIERMKQMQQQGGFGGGGGGPQAGQ